MATSLTCEQKLDQAECALHDLAMGKQLVEIQIKGRVYKFTPASMASLRRYIAWLKQECAAEANTCARPATPFLVC